MVSGVFGPVRVRAGRAWRGEQKSGILIIKGQVHQVGNWDEVYNVQRRNLVTAGDGFATD